MLKPSLLLALTVGLAALDVTGCGTKTATRNTTTDSGPAPGDGLLFYFDAAIAHCTGSVAPISDASALDASARNAALCVPSRHVSYKDDVEPVFKANCSGEVCHNGTWGGGRAYESLVGVRASECCDGRKLVLPGNPNLSYVVQKLKGIDLCAGGRMPFNRQIADGDVATLTDWICEGAPNL